MSSRRTARVSSVIREVVSTSILQELRDPRIQNVTVLGADVSPDLRYAKIRISIMGDEKEESLTMHGLNSARGYLQSKVAERVKTRYTPELSFEVDHGIARSFETSRILSEVLPQADEILVNDSTVDEDIDVDGQGLEGQEASPDASKETP